MEWVAVAVDEVVEGVTQGTSGGECDGTYDSTSGTGSGAGYVNSCIHSGSNAGSDGDTVWYNYAAASVGTITGTNNTIIATESICPKGWALPTRKQADAFGGASPGSSTYVPIFSPVYGGAYFKGTVYDETTAGVWWVSTAYNNAGRDRLVYRNGNLYTIDSGGRVSGLYIRCVSEEKDVSDLTYMQDMTPSVAAKAAWNLCPK